jgi:hypothetical protein
VTTELRLRELIDRLAAAEVRFVIVGGLAVNAWARSGPSSPPATARLSRPTSAQSMCCRGFPKIPPFAQLDAEAVVVDLGGSVVRVCSLEALLAMKRASDRARDRDDVDALEAAHPSGEEPGD